MWGASCSSLRGSPSARTRAMMAPARPSAALSRHEIDELARVRAIDAGLVTEHPCRRFEERHPRRARASLRELERRAHALGDMVAVNEEGCHLETHWTAFLRP